MSGREILNFSFGLKAMLIVDMAEKGLEPGEDEGCECVKLQLNDQTFSSDIVGVVAHNMERLHEQTMFDQTSNKLSQHNAFCIYYR